MSWVGKCPGLSALTHTTFAEQVHLGLSAGIEPFVNHLALGSKGHGIAKRRNKETGPIKGHPRAKHTQ